MNTDLATFDNALPFAVKEVFQHFPNLKTGDARFIRDMSGQIHVVLRANVETAELNELQTALFRALGPYSPGEEAGIMLAQDTIAGDALFEEPVLIFVIEDRHVRVIERRAVGQDWVAAPTPETKHRPRTVFYSLKGGVGRTTALALCARHLAGEGYTVLTIDMDLEAPGLGAQLLSREQHPHLGVIDWLVEDIVGNADEDLVRNLVAESRLAEAGLLVAPAFGVASQDAPENVVAKLARAYLEGGDDDTGEALFAQRLRRMVDALENAWKPDVVLIDSRAGLHETVAANLLHLEANVLLFAVDVPATWQGYRFLLAHLRQLAQSAETLGYEGQLQWRDRLKMVRARAELTRDDLDNFVSNAYAVWVDTLYEASPPPPIIRSVHSGTPNETPPPAEVGEEVGNDIFSFSQFDDAAPHWPLSIPRSDLYERLDPLKGLEALGESRITADFGEIFTYVMNTIQDDPYGDE